MSIHDDSFIPGWKKLTEAVHQYDCKILPQLFHPAYMAFPIPGTPRLIAPSNVGPYYAKEAPRSVTKEELKVIIKQFGEAALRVKTAGADGVEIHAAHAHGLLGGFLSPLYNKRTDEYGGDISCRLRLTLEVIEEVRKMCGKDFIIDVRISGDEYTDGGLNINDMIYVSKTLEKAGVDMLHVSGGTTIARGSSIPAPGTKMGSHALLSEEIKKHVSIPVATVGRITEPWIADELIANDKADICMIGRANLCDAEFVNKAMSGHVEDIRPCIGCLRCLTGIMFGKRVSCTINPSLEIENEDTIKDLKSYKSVITRESLSYNALLEKNLTNVELIPDVAFQLDPIYLDLPKGFEENNAVFTPNSRSIQEEQEEKAFGKLTKEDAHNLSVLLERTHDPAACIRRFTKAHRLPFLSLIHI